MPWGILECLLERSIGCIVAAWCFAQWGYAGLIGVILAWTLWEVFTSSYEIHLDE